MRAFADAAYNEVLFDDFRGRGNSNVSDLSMDDPSALFDRMYIKKKKVKKTKPRVKQEETRYYPSPGDAEHPIDDDDDLHDDPKGM